MSCEAIKMYTGLELIQTNMGKPIGKTSGQDIDADITARPDNSLMGIAKSDMTQWAFDCGVVWQNLEGTVCSTLGEALKWYAILLYAEADHAKKCKGCCDSRFLKYATDMVCRHLRHWPCMQKKFLARTCIPCEEEVNALPKNIWGGVVVGSCNPSSTCNCGSDCSCA